MNLAQENDLVNGTNKVEKYLGGIVRMDLSDPTSPVIGARATKIDFISETNITEALIHPVFSQVIFMVENSDNHDVMSFNFYGEGDIHSIINSEHTCDKCIDSI